MENDKLLKIYIQYIYIFDKNMQKVGVNLCAVAKITLVQ